MDDDMMTFDETVELIRESVAEVRNTPFEKRTDHYNYGLGGVVDMKIEIWLDEPIDTAVFKDLDRLSGLVGADIMAWGDKDHPLSDDGIPYRLEGALTVIIVRCTDEERFEDAVRMIDFVMNEYPAESEFDLYSLDLDDDREIRYYLDHKTELEERTRTADMRLLRIKGEGPEISRFITFTRKG